MSKIIIENTPSLKGYIRVDGAKNAALPILAASLLAHGASILEDTPKLKDVESMCELLQWLGPDIRILENNTVQINSSRIRKYAAPYELASKMRASFLVMGPLLARRGRTRISLPGGCAIGTRPIDLHLKGFAAMGAKITQGHGYV